MRAGGRWAESHDGKKTRGQLAERRGYGGAHI